MIDDQWIQIPVAPKYEINQRGQVRNVKTGKILSTTLRYRCSKNVNLHADGRRHWFTINNLLWLTHGKKPKRSSTVPVPVIVSKGNAQCFFDSARKAAEFIADRENLVVRSVRVKLWRRHKEIAGWRINYQR